MDPKKAPDPERPRSSSGWTLLIAPVLTALIWVVTQGHELGHAREGTAHSLISQLSQAAKAYELDYAVYPPGDGKGSKSLAAALQSKGAKQMKYFEFDPVSPPITPAGDIRNPVDEEKVIYYRCPGIHNPKSFDLWCEDGKGRVDGINNWE